jgi:hypothetical protein
MYPQTAVSLAKEVSRKAAKAAKKSNEEFMYSTYLNQTIPSRFSKNSFLALFLFTVFASLRETSPSPRQTAVSL